MHRTTIGIYLIILSLTFLPLVGWGQPGDPNDGQKPGVPITGLEWLLLGGGVWGAKKIYDLKKKK
jgi:hypothetical protein